MGLLANVFSSWLCFLVNEREERRSGTCSFPIRDQDGFHVPTSLQIRCPNSKLDRILRNLLPAIFCVVFHQNWVQSNNISTISSCILSSSFQKERKKCQSSSFIKITLKITTFYDTWICWEVWDLGSTIKVLATSCSDSFWTIYWFVPWKKYFKIHFCLIPLFSASLPRLCKSLLAPKKRPML